MTLISPTGEITRCSSATIRPLTEEQNVTVMKTLERKHDMSLNEAENL